MAAWFYGGKRKREGEFTYKWSAELTEDYGEEYTFAFVRDDSAIFAKNHSNWRLIAPSANGRGVEGDMRIFMNLGYVSAVTLSDDHTRLYSLYDDREYLKAFDVLSEPRPLEALADFGPFDFQQIEVPPAFNASNEFVPYRAIQEMVKDELGSKFVFSRDYDDSSEWDISTHKISMALSRDTSTMVLAINCTVSAEFPTGESDDEESDDKEFHDTTGTFLSVSRNTRGVDDAFQLHEMMENTMRLRLSHDGKVVVCFDSHKLYAVVIDPSEMLAEPYLLNRPILDVVTLDGNVIKILDTSGVLTTRLMGMHPWKGGQLVARRRLHEEHGSTYTAHAGRFSPDGSTLCVSMSELKGAVHHYSVLVYDLHSGGAPYTLSHKYPSHANAAPTHIEFGVGGKRLMLKYGMQSKNTVPRVVVYGL
jgi:hypothetical protein